MRSAAAILAVALLGFSVRGQQQPAVVRPDIRPNTKTAGCTTSGCHAAELSHKYQHGPTAISACDACHVYNSPEAHTFQLKTEGKDLCTFCHVKQAGPGGTVAHEPFAKGDCLACHDPHGAETRTLLIKPDTNTLCVSCHEAVTGGGAHIHKPVSEGKCTDCHRSHAGDHAKLLLKPGREMCLSCHETVQHQLDAGAHAHEPVLTDCVQCHTPHASSDLMQLRQPPSDLCISCHEEVGKTATAAAHPHSAALEGRACLNCHVPHASSRSKLAKDDPTAACLACHSEAARAEIAAKAGPPKPIFRSDLARMAANQPVKVQKPAPLVAEFSIKDAHLHGPVADGDCAACHAVHGGDREDLLRANYSNEFYQAFSTDAFSLCFTCHDSKLATVETGMSTNFRDGARNLHFLHVNQEQGRNCRACHTVHASKHDLQIRETTTYGNWQLPINFVKTETGGSCAVGCHREYSYDRGGPRLEIKTIDPAAPVAADPAGPPPAPAPTPAPSPEVPPSAPPPEPPDQRP